MLVQHEVLVMSLMTSQSPGLICLKVLEQQLQSSTVLGKEAEEARMITSACQGQSDTANQPNSFSFEI